jgi:hypothetical protein
MFAPVSGQPGVTSDKVICQRDTKQTITQPDDTYTLETYIDDGLLMLLLITSVQNERLT